MLASSRASERTCGCSRRRKPGIGSPVNRGRSRRSCSRALARSAGRSSSTSTTSRCGPLSRAMPTPSDQTTAKLSHGAPARSIGPLKASGPAWPLASMPKGGIEPPLPEGNRISWAIWPSCARSPSSAVRIPAGPRGACRHYEGCPVMARYWAQAPSGNQASRGRADIAKGIPDGARVMCWPPSRRTRQATRRQRPRVRPYWSARTARSLRPGAPSRPP